MIEIYLFSVSFTLYTVHLLPLKLLLVYRNGFIHSLDEIKQSSVPSKISLLVFSVYFFYASRSFRRAG